MKLRTALAAAACLASARADVTITQQLEQPESGPVTMTLKIKDGMIRNDVNSHLSAIMDSKTGDTITLMHDQKIAVKMPGALVKAAQQQAMDAQETPATPEPTGRREVINGFQCEEFVSTHAGKRVESWITRDIPDAAEITRQIAALGPEANPARDFPSPAGIDGLPIRTSIELSPGKSLTMTVTGLTRDPVPVTEFEIPPGYAEMAMPKIPGF
jgi:hypothetical protein